MRFIKCTTDNQVSIIETPGTDYKAIAESIGADLIQHVRISRDTIIICDEEGLLKEENKCNPIASILYGTPNHGQPIAGDVLFARIGNAPDRDYEDIPSEMAEKMVAALAKAIDALATSGMSDELHRKHDNSKPAPPIIMSLDEHMAQTHEGKG